MSTMLLARNGRLGAHVSAIRELARRLLLPARTRKKKQSPPQLECSTSVYLKMTEQSLPPLCSIAHGFYEETCIRPLEHKGPCAGKWRRRGSMMYRLTWFSCGGRYVAHRLYEMRTAVNLIPEDSSG